MKDPGWPADHAIGVYLSVDGHKTLVATARGAESVSAAFRHLADTWDYLNDPDRPCVDYGWLYDAHAVTSLSGISTS